jgi:hypothetical protein
MYTVMTGTSLTRTTQPTMSCKYNSKQRLAIDNVYQQHLLKGNVGTDDYYPLMNGLESVVSMAMSEKSTTFTYSRGNWYVTYIRDKKKWKEDEDFLLTAIKGSAVFYETGDES